MPLKFYEMELEKFLEQSRNGCLSELIYWKSMDTNNAEKKCSRKAVCCPLEELNRD